MGFNFNFLKDFSSEAKAIRKVGRGAKKVYKETENFSNAVIDRGGGMVVRGGIRLGALVAEPLPGEQRKAAREFISKYAENEGEAAKKTGVGRYDEQSTGGKLGRKVGTTISAGTQIAGIGKFASVGSKVGGTNKVLSFLGGSVGGSIGSTAQGIAQDRDVNLARELGTGLAFDVATLGLGKGIRLAKNSLKPVYADEGEFFKQLSKEPTREGIKNALKKAGLEADDDMVSAIADNKDPNIIRNLVTGERQIAREVPVNVPPPQKQVGQDMVSSPLPAAKKAPQVIARSPSESPELIDSVKRGKLQKAGEVAPIDSLKLGSDVSGGYDSKQVAKYVDDIKQGRTIDPIIIDSKGFVQDGKHRLEAMRQLGVKDIPVVQQIDKSKLSGAAQQSSLAKNPGQDIVSATVPKSQRQRGLLKTTQAENLPEATRVGSKAVQPQTYQQLNIEQSLTTARGRVDTDFDNVRKTVNQALDSGQQVTPETASLARALIEKAGSQGQDDVVEEVLSKIAPLATTSGQANVVWRGLANAYDPEKMVKFARKIIEKNNEKAGFLTKAGRKISGKGSYTLDNSTEKLIRDKMRIVRSIPDGERKETVMREIFEAINDRVPPGASEMFDAFRYQNLLSSPRTQARNTIGNLFNTMITRPATIATKASTDWFGATLFGKERQTYLKEVPVYYKGLFNSTGDGIEAMKGVWRRDIPIGQPDLQQLKNSKLPKGLTVVGRAMEAQDRFFQTLISSGEYAVQKAKGVSDDVARTEAERVAKYSLYRNATDAKNVTGQGALLSKIDQFTDTVTKIGQKHKSFRWFVPFIRTPMNISKQFIEFSPAGVATLHKASGARRDEQIAKALMGSTVTAIGAKVALDGNTTWAPPTNQKERDEFYATGKKPYSIKIGGKWVPMISFGPFAYALALPAALKDANDRAPMDASAMDKLTMSITSQAKFFSQQTYVQGIANFVDLLSGTGEGNIKSNLGQTASQAIPLSGLQRYVAGIIDPVYRKQTSAIDSLKGGTPFLSKTLEGRKDVFTGEPAKRNITDYVLPYTLGSPGKGEEQTKKEAYLEFHHIQGKANKTQISKQIKDALIAKDKTKAKELAREYNKKYEEAFKDWREQYSEYRSDKELVKEYKRKKITNESLNRWLKEIKKGETP